MIVLDQKNRIFTLHTQNTTYQMKADQYNVLLHTYYGSRIDGFDLSALIQYGDRSFTPNPSEAGSNRNYSLDVMPQEYSTCGVGDFRLPSIELELANGSHTADMRYEGFRLEKGKYAMEGLPGFYSNEDETETLVITLKDAAAQVDMELYYSVFEDYDLITRTVRVVNQGTEEIRLCRCASLCLDFLQSDMDFITFNASHLMERCMDRGALRSGIQSVGSVRGISSHQHNPFVILCDRGADEETGICYGAMLLYSGNFEAAVECSQYENSRLIMGIHPYHFCWTLAAGQVFTTPEAAIICSPNGFGQMSRQYHRAIRRHLLRDPYTGRRKPVLVNNWEATYFDFTADRLADIAREAAALGIELFVMDDGWFGSRNNDNCSLGDWQVNLDKLPGGLEALASRIKNMGMKFGIWMEPEMVNEDSDLYRAHPDWVLQVPGRVPSRGRGLVLDFSRKDVRDHIYDQMKKVLSCVEISYLKWDMNRSLTDVWSAALPARFQGEVYHRYVLGIYDLLERLHRDYPHILIEGCCGGGGRFDGGMLYYTPQIWCSDDTDAVDRLRIQYGTSFCYPVCTMGAHVSAVPNEQNGRVTPLKTRGVTAMSGAFGYEMDLGKCTAEEKMEIQRQVESYKIYYDLLHDGDYYRLSSPFQDGIYTAWEHVSANRREALVSVVYDRNGAAPLFGTLRLKGLDPAFQYQINRTDSFYSGEILMKAGYPLPQMKGDYSAVQIYLRASE